MEKIKLKDLSSQDLSVISNAAEKYHTLLETLAADKKNPQYYIHLSILRSFRFDLVKKLLKRKVPKKNSLSLEIHEAFILYAALQFYSDHTYNHLESAIVSGLTINLFPMLPCNPHE